MFLRNIFKRTNSTQSSIQKNLLSSETQKIKIKKRKQKIPVALQEAIWITHMGRVFQGKCKTSWCLNYITVFDFQAGHNIPESKGGSTTIENLVPICSRCNHSMGNRYTFDEWCRLSASVTDNIEIVDSTGVKCC